jgi:hypothetical protein
VDCCTNRLTDLSSFVSNAAAGGLGTGDKVFLYDNPLSSFARTNQIPFLQARGAEVFFTP